MAKNPDNLLSEYGQVLSGYAALFTYQMSHFCVKADPVALLSIEIPAENGNIKFEHLCNPILIDEYTYGFIPETEGLIPTIVKAVLKEHPEFRIGYLMCKENEVFPVTSEREQDDSFVKIVAASVPDVDSDRRKAILDGIKALYNRCKSQYEKCKEDYSKSLAMLVLKVDPTASKEYSDGLDEITNQYVDIRDKLYEAKQQEVEDAYNEYQTKHEAAQAKELEDAKAKGLDVVQGFNMFDNLNN